MERYCGSIQPAIKIRQYPYASINNYIFVAAQLSQVKLKYNLSECLRLRPAPTPPHGVHSSDACESLLILYLPLILTGNLQPADPTCVLIPPRKASVFTECAVYEKVLIHFATCFKMTVTQLQPHIKNEHITQWARVQHLEGGGDDMYASSFKKPSDDYRDVT